MATLKNSALNLHAALGAVLLICPDIAFGYSVRTAGVVRVPELSSVLGEPRADLCLLPDPDGTTCRFHEGVDTVGVGFAAATQVNPIEDGIVTKIGNTSVEVTANGRTFKYDHVIPSVAENDPVTTADVIGRIQDLGNQTHIHLEEVLSVGGIGFDVNPQRSGGIVFADDEPPVFRNTTIGTVTGFVIPIKEFTTDLDGRNPSPAAFPKLSNGSFAAKEVVDIVATASGDIARKGIYSARATVAPESDPFDIIYDGRNNVVCSTSA